MLRGPVCTACVFVAIAALRVGAWWVGEGKRREAMITSARLLRFLQ